MAREDGAFGLVRPGPLSTSRACARILQATAASARVRKLLAEAAELPEAERVELAQELLRLIPADDVEREWLEEITWRAERVLRGESNGRLVDDAELAAVFYDVAPSAAR